MARIFHSLPFQLSWLGLCILVALWGLLIDPAWQSLWYGVGIVGLAATFGLQFLVRTAPTPSQQEIDHRCTNRMEKFGVDAFSQHALILAVERIVKDIDHQGLAGRDPRPATGNRRMYERRNCQTTVRVTTTPDQNDLCQAVVQNISANGVRLRHRAPLHSQNLLLTFSLSDGMQIDLETELIWRNVKKGNWFFSGGKLVNVLDVEGQTPRHTVHPPSVAGSA